MKIEDKLLAQKIYFILGGLFIASLVVSNLIFQKFFYSYPFGDFTIFGAKFFEISVGIIPYPITFLVTDIISEIYGKKKANQVVTVGIFASNVHNITLLGQVKGILVVGVFAFISSFVTLYLINKIIPIRAGNDEEMQGLDVDECGIEAYPEFKRAF